MRSRMWRRFISSFDSPGPRVPMPPAQPRQHQALPNQAAGLVLQLRQFDLQLALGGRCALGENVQDQRRAVNHLHAQNLLQIARLNACQFLVEDAQISFQRLTLPGTIHPRARAR